MKFSRFKLEPESVSYTTVHISSEKYVNSISANQFGILGLPETLIQQDKLLQSHFVPRLPVLSLVFYFLCRPPLHLRSLVKENAEMRLVDKSQVFCFCFFSPFPILGQSFWRCVFLIVYSCLRKASQTSAAAGK